jgi:hypothetical protein
MLLQEYATESSRDREPRCFPEFNKTNGVDFVDKIEHLVPLRFRQI